VISHCLTNSDASSEIRDWRRVWLLKSGISATRVLRIAILALICRFDVAGAGSRTVAGKVGVFSTQSQEEP
jgi:hypothetical protein